MKIRITILNENGTERDHITREVRRGGFIIGVVNDLFLILRRNFSRDVNYAWMISESGNLTISDKDR